MASVADKAEARRQARAVRAEAHRAQGQGEGTSGLAVERLMGALAPFGDAALAGYMPIRTEIDPLPAMARHAGLVGAPVIAGEGLPLTFRRWRPGAALIPGPFGALVPAEGEEIVPRVVIVPLLAFDRRGFRLGYGGGFYDRTLARLRAEGPVTAIGFAFAAQEVASVPTEPTDEPLDLIVTEAGVIRPGRAAG